MDKYSEATGIDIVLLSGNAQQLLERIEVEGINSPADLFITVDAGVLWQASQANIFEPISSSILTNNIPKNFRDPEGKWFGLSKRIRAIVVNDKGNQAPPKSYHELAEKEWKNRLCLRTSAKVYNQSLIASMLFRLSEEETHKILSGWSNNLATKVFSSDTLALKAVQSGQCIPKRNGARTPIFYKFIVCYCGMPSHFVGTESYKKRYRIFLTAVK